MTIDTLGMIRRGWQDGAATVAPQVPGLADLLEKRLAEAVRLGALDESSLLAIVDAATQLAANSGAVDVVPALSKRLRRHVYEYLLSLDAAVDDRRAAPVPQAPETGDASLLIGSDEVAALGRHQHGQPPSHLEPESPAAEDAAPAGSPSPQFGFHIGDPDDLLTSVPGPGERDSNGRGVVPELFVPSDLLPPGGAGRPGLRRASFADPSSWPKPMTPQLRGGRTAPPDQAPDEYLAAQPSAPREEATEPDPSAPPSHPGLRELIPAAAAANDLPASLRGTDDNPTEVLALPPATPSDESDQPGPPRRETPSSDTRSGAGAAQGERRPGASSDLDGDEQTASAPTPGMPVAPATPEVRFGQGWPSTAAPAAEPDPGWALRRPESVELHLAPPMDSEPRLASSGDQIPEKDLAPLRTRVEERLRRKRCDDAAAILQQAAQELGGQAVAELALDAGDRCRTLGKRNAALNCYLAASRADPVYEVPLARLADICIDDQDIDLAVSYLERIARLTRLRGDQRGALRIYRKIATIAPYRDDVLEMLMRAQTTGRIDA